MAKHFLLIVLGLTVVIAVAAAADNFDTIKKQLTEADCVRLEFVSIIESEVFDLVDSAYGAACLASDGRYHVTIGQDVYLYDGALLHSFSYESNQVTLEKLDDKIDHSQEITFLTRLDELYETHPLPTRNSYQLRRRPGAEGDLPDSLTAVVGGDPPVIQHLEFYDINDDFNRLELFNQRLDSACTDDDFRPAFPDSAETVKLF